MNPAAVRTAIVDGLTARGAPWTGVGMFRYPAGKLLDRVSGFALGELSPIDSEMNDLSGETVEITYQLDGGLHVGSTGSADDDYEAVETAAIAMIKDFEAWLITVDHGKSMGVPTVDSLELTDWDLAFAASAPIAVVAFTLEVVEMVSN